MAQMDMLNCVGANSNIIIFYFEINLFNLKEAEKIEC